MLFIFFPWGFGERGILWVWYLNRITTPKRKALLSDLVGHGVDAGPGVVDGELGCVVGLSDHVQVALVVLVPLPRHADQRLAAAHDHRLVLPVDPRQNLREPRPDVTLNVNNTLTYTLQLKPSIHVHTLPFKSLGSLRNVLFFQSTVFINEDNIKWIINTLSTC